MVALSDGVKEKENTGVNRVLEEGPSEDPAVTTPRPALSSDEGSYRSVTVVTVSPGTGDGVESRTWRGRTLDRPQGFPGGSESEPG